MTIQTLKNDILAGITVAIVALPLALAFGVVSGAGAIAGLYGAIILGFIAALLASITFEIFQEKYLQRVAFFFLHYTKKASKHPYLQRDKPILLAKQFHLSL